MLNGKEDKIFIERLDSILIFIADVIDGTIHFIKKYPHLFLLIILALYAGYIKDLIIIFLSMAILFSLTIDSR